MGIAEYVVVGSGPLLVFGVIMYTYLSQNLQDVKKNWVKYRCHPAYMPFSSMVRPDISASENFGYCTNLFAKSTFDYATMPVNQLFDIFNGIIESFMGDINQFLTFIAGIDNFIFSLANTVFGKLQNGFSVLTLQLGHVRDIMSRITGSAYYAAFIISTMVSFLFSVFNLMMSLLKSVVIMIFALGIVISLFYPIFLVFFLPIGALIGISFCFHPDTVVGGKLIKNIKVGDRIPGGRVTSVFYFECAPSVELYVHNGVIVSGKHLVLYNDKWVYVEETGSPLYTEERPKYLVCLNTDTNKVVINDTVFADYEETNEPGALSEIEMLVWGKHVDQDTIPSLHPSSRVRLKNGDFVPLSRVKIGEELLEGRVTGIVLSSGYRAEWYDVDGCLVSAGQPVNTGSISLAKNVGKRSEKTTPSLGIQLFIDNETGWFTINDRLLVRDYPDAHNLETMQAIQNVVLKHLNKK